MEAPRLLLKNGKKYILLREYETFYLYRESETGQSVKFNKNEVKSKLRMRTRGYDDFER